MPTTTEKGGAPAQRTRPSARQAKENLADLSIREQLIYIQQMLAAPKDNENAEKHFRYRTLDGIIAAVKPLLLDCSCTLTFSEDVLSIEQGAYIISRPRLPMYAVKALRRRHSPAKIRGFPACAPRRFPARASATPASMPPAASSP